MVLWIQIVGALFGMFFIYLAFLNFKRKEFTVNEWAIWTLVAAAFVVVTLVPNVLDPFVRTLNIARKFDFMVILGFMFLTAASFYTYRTSMKNQKKLEEVVRKVAIESAERKKK